MNGVFHATIFTLFLLSTSPLPQWKYTDQASYLQHQNVASCPKVPHAHKGIHPSGSHKLYHKYCKPVIRKSVWERKCVCMSWKLKIEQNGASGASINTGPLLSLSSLYICFHHDTPIHQDERPRRKPPANALPEREFLAAAPHPTTAMNNRSCKVQEECKKNDID